MYKAIIADDEETVRRGLVTHFNWGKHGVEVAGVFDDGVPALDFVRRNEVDIIVTDVRMSHMDGITLAKNVLESYPGVKIIFISGYADVGYLRDALKMEAVDYILKSTGRGDHQSGGHAGPEVFPAAGPGRHGPKAGTKHAAAAPAPFVRSFAEQ